MKSGDSAHCAQQLESWRHVLRHAR